MRLDQVPMLFFDTETTGLDVETAEIVQFGAVAYPDGFSGRPYNFFTYLRPQQPIPAAATRVHGITDADVASAPTWAQKGQEILFLLDEYQTKGFLCGYNALEYDLPLVNAMSTREVNLGRWQFAPGLNHLLVLDPLVYRKWWTPQGSAKLEYYNPGSYQAHNALTDCRKTADLVRDLYANGRVIWSDQNFRILPRTVPGLLATQSVYAESLSRLRARLGRYFYRHPITGTYHHSIGHDAGATAKPGQGKYRWLVESEERKGPDSPYPRDPERLLAVLREYNTNRNFDFESTEDIDLFLRARATYKFMEIRDDE